MSVRRHESREVEEVRPAYTAPPPSGEKLRVKLQAPKTARAEEPVVNCWEPITGGEEGRTRGGEEG